MKLYFLAFVVSFCYVAVKGWQHKNANKNLYLNMFITSYIMAILDVALIGLIVKADSMQIAIASGAGASIGMILAVFIHNKIYKSQ